MNPIVTCVVTLLIEWIIDQSLRAILRTRCLLIHRHNQFHNELQEPAVFSDDQKVYANRLLNSIDYIYINNAGYMSLVMFRTPGRGNWVVPNCK